MGSDWESVCNRCNTIRNDGSESCPYLYRPPRFLYSESESWFGVDTVYLRLWEMEGNLSGVELFGPSP